MATVDEVFEELNFPSSSKLRRVLDSRGIAYDRKDVEKLVRREAVRQVQAPAYKLNGKIAAHGINDKWFCDLIDFTAAPSDKGKRTGLGETKDSEVYIPVVQDFPKLLRAREIQLLEHFFWCRHFIYQGISLFGRHGSHVKKSNGLAKSP